METKRCPKCGETKLTSEFSKNTRRGKPCFQAYCKKCQSTKSDKIKPIVPIQGEVWKSVIGYEGYYSVSNMGRIRSDSRYKKCHIGGFISQDFIIKSKQEKFGYIRCTLQKDGVIKTLNVHRLVALAFIPNPDNLPVVNHLDKVKSNNVPDNLEWTTRAENTTHGYIGVKKCKQLGVMKDPRYNSYQVVLKGKYIGSYPTEELATIACKEAMKKLGIVNKYADPTELFEMNSQQS